jgi:hypothetical protein
MLPGYEEAVASSKPDGNLIVCGNSKLGSDLIWHWDLPSVHTCYWTNACLTNCYTNAGNYLFQSDKYYQNYLLSLREDFHELMLAEISRVNAEVFRPHTSGDFYNEAYALKWLWVMTERPETDFYLYSRSWRKEPVANVLEAMSDLPNVHVWYSLDKDTGYPTKMHPRTRTAYMLCEEEKELPHEVDLVFRVKRKTIQKKLDGCPVCPVEQGIKRQVDITCQTCQICFTPKRSFYFQQKVLSLAS